MNRKQFLINLHTTGTAAPSSGDVKFGEIIVQHNSSEQALYTKFQSGSSEVFAKFITDKTVDSKISNSISSEHNALAAVSAHTLGVSASTAALSAATVALAAFASGYTIVKKTTGLAANVREAYVLKDANGSEKSVQIPVYKDNSLLGVKLTKSGATFSNGTWSGGSGKDVLALAYLNASGNTQVVEIDVADFLRESEFGNGLQVSAGTVSVKIDSAQDSKYISVSSNGIKLSGITSAISTAKSEAIKAAVVEVKEGTDNSHLTVSSATSTTGTSVSISLSDVASDAALTNLQTAVGVTGSAATAITVDSAKVLSGTTTVKKFLGAIDNVLNDIKTNYVSDITVASPLKNYIDEASETNGVSTLSATSETIEVLSSGYTSTSFVDTSTTDAVGNKVTDSGVKIATNSSDVHDLTFDFSELVIDCGSY